MQSGSKLVVAIFGLAARRGGLVVVVPYRDGPSFDLVLGPALCRVDCPALDRYRVWLKEERANRATMRFRFSPKPTLARPPGPHQGTGHGALGNSILTDGNYVWENPVNTDDWRWCLQFTDGGVTATLLFNEDFSILGRLNRRAMRCARSIAVRWRKRCASISPASRRLAKRRPPSHPRLLAKQQTDLGHRPARFLYFARAGRFIPLEVMWLPPAANTI